MVVGELKANHDGTQERREPPSRGELMAITGGVASTVNVVSFNSSRFPAWSKLR